MNVDDRPSMRRRQIIGAAATTILLGAGTPPKSPRTSQRPAKIALVLGGGGCRGYGHIGFLKGIDEPGLKPDLIVGSSVGSLIGALYAAGVSPVQLERVGRQVSANTLRDWVFPNLGVFGGARIARFVKAQTPIRLIEALPIRFAAVTTDLQNGKRVVLDRGDLAIAVQASSSLPGLMEPVRFGGRYYVDGNLSSPVPVTAARELGADRVVAVDVSFPPEQADLKDPLDALYQGFSILTRRLALEDRERADLAIEPGLPTHNDMSQATLAALVAAGYQAAQDSLPHLKRLFDRSG